MCLYWSDRLDMMDDDCDIEGFPLKQDKKSCQTCANNHGMVTMSEVAMCNCCDDHEFYIPEKEAQNRDE
jgi:hypothetical protein